MRQRRAYQRRMRVASAVLVTRSVVSRNHSAARPWAAAVARAHGRRTADRRGPGAGQRHGLVAQCHLGDARRPAVLAGLFAGLRPRAQPLHRDRGGAAGRQLRTSSSGARPSARRASSPCPRRGRPSRGPAGRPAGRARGARGTGRGSRPRGPSCTPRGFRAAARPPAPSRAAQLDPAERRPRLRGAACLSRGVGGRGRVEGGPQHAQRHPVGVDRQRRMQVQAAGHGAGLVRPMAPSPCVWSRRVKFDGCRPGCTAPSRARASGQRALAMRLEDVVDRHRAVGGLVDQPVMSLDQGARSIGGAGDGALRARPYVARSGPGARSGARRPAAPRRTRGPPRTRRRAHRPPPAAQCPLRARRGVRATPVPRRTYTLPCAFPAPRACGPGARARRSHPPEPSWPRARSSRRVRSRRQTSPAARGDSRGDARSRRRPPVRPGPTRARPGCGSRCRGAPATGTVPAPGAVSARRPSSQPIQASRARRRRQGRKPDAAQPAMRRAHQIPQLRNRQTGPAPRGCSCAISVFQTRRCPSVSTRTSAKSAQLADRARARPLPAKHRVRQHTRAAHTAATANRVRQRDMACRLEVGQRRAATRALPPAAPIAESERFTNAIGDLPEAVRLARPPRPARRAAGEVAPQAAPNLILNLHAGYSSEVAS